MVHIPSYDELEPSIPGIGTSRRDSVSRLTRLFSGNQPGAASGLRPATGARVSGRDVDSRIPNLRLPLYVCLYSPGLAGSRESDGGADVLPAFAREFSPRIETFGERLVLIDV